MVISAYLVIGRIVEDPQIEYIYALLFIIAGLFFYVPFVYYKKTILQMGKKLILQITGPTWTFLSNIFFRGINKISAKIFASGSNNS